MSSIINNLNQRNQKPLLGNYEVKKQFPMLYRDNIFNQKFSQSHESELVIIIMHFSRFNWPKAHIICLWFGSDLKIARLHLIWWYAFRYKEMKKCNYDMREIIWD